MILILDILLYHLVMTIHAGAGPSPAVIGGGELHPLHCVQLLPEHEELHPAPLVVDKHDPVLAIALLRGGLTE